MKFLQIKECTSFCFFADLSFQININLLENFISESKKYMAKTDFIIIGYGVFGKVLKWPIQDLIKSSSHINSLGNLCS